MIASVPTASAVVVQPAVRKEERVTAEQPVMAVVFEKKSTVPVGVGVAAGPTNAVNVTDCPEVEGFWLEVTVVVEAVRVVLSTA
jgi:hypothetical protein